MTALILADAFLGGVIAGGLGLVAYATYREWRQAR